MKKLAATVGLAVLLVSPFALANDPPAQQVTSYEMDPLEVEGGREGPMGDVLSARNRAPLGSLLPIRWNFVPELLKTIEGF